MERPGRRVGLWLFGILVLTAVILAVLRLGELGRFTELARAARSDWLLIAIGLQVMTYVCAAAIWHIGLLRAGAPRRFYDLLPLGLAKLFTDQALPSMGISGSVLVIDALERRGVPPPTAMTTLLVGLVSFYIAYALAALGGLAILQSYPSIGSTTISVWALFILFVIGVPGLVFALRSRPDHPLVHWFRQLPAARRLLEALTSAPSAPLHDPLLMVRATAWQLGIFLLDGGTLYAVLRALNQTCSFPSAFASFMMAEVVATIGPMPLGLGTFEGTAIAVLHLTGVPLEGALAATLLFRGFTFWLPMLPGLWLVRRELSSPPRVSSGSEAHKCQT
jgi:glycosyltransferase 2 family protein